MLTPVSINIYEKRDKEREKRESYKIDFTHINHINHSLEVRFDLIELLWSSKLRFTVSLNHF